MHSTARSFPLIGLFVMPGSLSKFLQCNNRLFEALKAKRLSQLAVAVSSSELRVFEKSSVRGMRSRTP